MTLRPPPWTTPRKCSLNSRKFITSVVENWPAKVLSVALALVLFVFHRMSTLETRFFSVPLAVQANEALIPASSYARSIKVSLRGDANSIYPILESDIEAFIDLTRHESEGWYRAPVQVRKKGSALGVEPLEISVDPLEIYLQLDRKISKTLPLTANLRGKVASGFDMVSHSISPAQVIVDGPLNALDSVIEFRTDIIELDGRNGDFNVMVNIQNPNPLFVIRGNGMAEFRGIIRPSVPVRNIENIPIELIGLNSQFKAEASSKTGSVRIEGSQIALDIFIPAPGFFTVDCSSLAEPGTFTLPVFISLPNDFTLVRREPDEITVTLVPDNVQGDDAL